MKFQSPPIKKARIEIIPMIDAIFFLLVFFMFSSLSMIKMKGSNVALPTNTPPQSVSAPTASQAAAMSKFVVTVNDKGEYFINKNRTDAAALAGDLQTGLKARPGAVVIINVAKSQTTQNLISVMDAVNRAAPPGAGPLQVMIATEPVDADGMAIRGGKASS